MMGRPENLKSLILFTLKKVNSNRQKSYHTFERVNSNEQKNSKSRVTLKYKAKVDFARSLTFKKTRLVQERFSLGQNLNKSLTRLKNFEICQSYL